MSPTWEVQTPHGPARIHHYPCEKPRATLVLGHGAGRSLGSPDLRAVAEALPADGVEVLLVEQPWHLRGQRLAGPAATLDAAWAAALRDIRSRGLGQRRLVVGGRSTGARVACRSVTGVAPDALLLIAFPLFPVRRNDFRRNDATGAASARADAAASTRLGELAAAARLVATVVVQGGRDRHGRPGDISAGLAQVGAVARVVPVPWADHGWSVPASAPRSAALGALVIAARAAALGSVDEHR